MRIRFLLLTFSVSITLLWTFLVPLWDGFDEPHHFSYVQSLAATRAFPVLGRTALTAEVWTSLRGSPVSAAVKRCYPMLRTFDEFRSGALPEAATSPPPPNYESHQAPLVYALLAPVEFVTARAGIGISARVRILRALLLITAFCLFWRITGACGTRRPAAFFLVAATEMFLASCGHVANDALAIPLFVWLFFEAERRTWRAPVLLAAGLLTKAYFLALAPIVIWRLRHRWRLLLAALILPALWYARNWWVYGNLSGMQEQLTPIGWNELANAALRLPWRASLGETYRGALWMANSSFNQWSVWQVNLIIALLLTAVLLAMRGSRPRIRWLAAYAGTYALALAYAAVQTFVYTKRTGAAASAWYATPLWLLAIVVIFAGEAPRWMRRTLLAVWTYWFVATFWLRLIPWYAGVADGPANAANLARWYGTRFSTIRQEIGDPILMLTLLATALAVATAASLIRPLWPPKREFYSR